MWNCPIDYAEQEKIPVELLDIDSLFIDGCINKIYVKAHINGVAFDGEVAKASHTEKLNRMIDGRDGNVDFFADEFDEMVEQIDRDQITWESV
jgi:hypothetical protein